MKTLFRKAMLAGFCLLGVLSTGARAQGSDRDGCSEATLRGDYAFTVSGTIWTTDPTGAPLVIERDGIAMTHFDGRGNLTQVDYVASSPNAPQMNPPKDPTTGFHIDESGTYQVYSDCTGTFTINSPTSIITVNFVLSDHGRAIHTIVISLTLLKPSGPVPAVGVLIHSEGHKLGRVPEDRDDR